MPDRKIFAERTNWELALNRITQAKERLVKQGKKIADLTESNPTACGFSYPKEEILSVFSDEAHLSYHPNSKGIDSARQAVAQYYDEIGYSIDKERILLTSSTSEAYSVLLRLLVNPGERVLIPAPSYPLFEFIVELNDAHIDTYPIVYENNAWQIDIDGLKDAVCKETKVIILVNPNNPTGSFVKQSELDAINKICKENSIALICDEVFFDYNLDAQEHISLVNNNEFFTCVLGGLSKSLGLPQMKLSWIAINGQEKLIGEAVSRLDVILDTYLSVNTPVQNVLGKWLILRGEIQTGILKRIEKNISFLQKHFPDNALRVEGGWYAVIKLSSGGNEEQFVLNLLEKEHIFVHPGYFFDFNENGYIVLSLLPKEDVFEKAITKLKKLI